MKFGGSSLMTVDRIKNAAQIVAAAAAEGKQVIVVVSAMGRTTDELIRLSDVVTAVPDERELDALMATGEQVSATLMAMALQTFGYKARSVNGSQAGITTDERFGDARIQTMDVGALCACLNDGFIPVVTGFQGITMIGETTTLGRGGSDTTAIALAAAVHAERCDIYTDVNGIYSADPRIVRNAVKLDRVSVSEMLELSKSGAQVLNARSVEFAQDRHVAIRVRSTFSPADEGTLIHGQSNKSRHFTGVALNTNVNCIEIELERLELGPERNLLKFRPLRSETRRNLLKSLSDAGISAEIVSPVRPNPFRILLLVRKADTITALAILQKATLSIREIRVNSSLTSISLVATEITAKHEVDAAAAITSQQIPLTALAWHNQRLTFLVPDSMGVKAINILHSHFADIKLAAQQGRQPLRFAESH